MPGIGDIVMEKLIGIITLILTVFLLICLFLCIWWALTVTWVWAFVACGIAPSALVSTLLTYWLLQE